jgi:hypothetical protein
VAREHQIVQLLTLSLTYQSLDVGGQTGHLLMTRVFTPVRVMTSQRHGLELNCCFCTGLRSFISAASKPAAFTSYEIRPGLLEAVN